jgi:hypothetical protein
VADFVPQTGSTLQTRHDREGDRVGVSGLLVFIAGLVALLIATLLALTVVMSLLSREENSLRVLAPPRFKDEVPPFPAPRLQEDPAAELERMKQVERARLTSYGWVDQKAGIARIPVERALEIAAQKGLPSWPPPPGASALPGPVRDSAAAPKASDDARGGKKP